MNLRCLIVDDEKPAIELLARFIERTPGLNLASYTTKPLEALLLFEHGPIDITFLDIDMPQLSGTALAGLIKDKTNIVFTTSFRDFGPEAFEVEAADYLLKPILYERFLAAVQKIRQQKVAQTSDHFFVKTGSGQLTRVDVDGIIYIAGLLNYVEIYSKNEKVITYTSLTDITTLLPPAHFSRIHKSYIINHDYINQLFHDEVLLSNEKRLTIGRTYRIAFFQKIKSGSL
ncbi:MAG: LytTR family DNA-binding domain-containing protein [Bacteroidota bacterium]